MKVNSDPPGHIAMIDMEIRIAKTLSEVSPSSSCRPTRRKDANLIDDRWQQVFFCPLFVVDKRVSEGSLVSHCTHREPEGRQPYGGNSFFAFLVSIYVLSLCAFASFFRFWSSVTGLRNTGQCNKISSSIVTFLIVSCNSFSFCILFVFVFIHFSFFFPCFSFLLVWTKQQPFLASFPLIIVTHKSKCMRTACRERQRRREEPEQEQENEKENENEKEKEEQRKGGRREADDDDNDVELSCLLFPLSLFVVSVSPYEVKSLRSQQSDKIVNETQWESNKQKRRKQRKRKQVKRAKKPEKRSEPGQICSRKYLSVCIPHFATFLLCCH